MTLAFALALWGLTQPAWLFAQADDFNDGNDDGWTRYDPIGSHPDLPDLATFSFTNGGYRIQTSPSPAPTVVGPGRAGSLRMDVNYTNFYVAVDVLDWDDTLVQVFGLMARVQDVGLGTTKGYAMTYNFPGHDIDISRIDNESAHNVGVTGNDQVDLVKGHRYRFVFIGKGSELTGQVYELPDATHPLVNVTGADATYASGISGLVVYDNSDTENNSTDATFDNYFALDVTPPQLLVAPNFFEVIVSWRSDATDFKLQAAPSLSGSSIDWTDIPPDVIVPVGDYLDYREDFLIGNKFFRLIRP